MDSYAMMLLVNRNRPPFPYEVKYFMDTLSVTKNLDVPFIGGKTPVPYNDRLVYRAACFLTSAREQVEDLIREPPKVQAVTGLPSWALEPMSLESLTDVAVTDYTILHLKAVDNVLWKFWKDTTCLKQKNGLGKKKRKEK
jgi:hypothetical protein